MASLEDVFEKSELSESKKKSKMIFGRLLINLRKQGHIKLYSLLGGVADTDIVDGHLKLLIKDNSSYEMINNESDINLINAILKELNTELMVCVDNAQKDEIDEYKFIQFLNEEFGKILTIK